MINSQIDKVGVEIEGAWNNKRAISERVYHDSSVRFNFSYPDYGGNLVGEIQSSPLEDLKKICYWIRRSYPNHINETCGLHVHVSTKTRLDYTLIMQRKFYAFFMEGMRAWGDKHLSKDKPEDKAFWNRLEGENRYCRDYFNPVSQIKGKIRKYTHLNFGAFREHGTVECRLLPVFTDKEKSILGVSFFVNLIDGYLKQAKPSRLAKKHLQLLES